MKKEKLPPHIQRFKKIYNRYRRNYRIIVCLWIVSAIAIGYFVNLFWGAMAVVFGLWSWINYEEGSQENCMDEWEYAYPEDGFRQMFKSWPWFIPVMITAYICCKLWMPYLFE